MGPSLIMPGRFSPLSGTSPDENGVILAGYQEYGGVDDPIIRGSLVKLTWSPISGEYNVFEVARST